VKLRVRHNSIRFRLGRSEVDLLQRGMECSETIYFPDSKRLEYVIQPCSRETITASFSDQVIRVEVPAQDLERWGASDQVGLSTEIHIADEPPLHVLIEKDFRCLDQRVSEDEADSFENPLERHPGP